MTQQVALTDGTGANAKQVGNAKNPLVAKTGTYIRAAAVGATAGDAILCAGVTTAGTVTLTLSDGSTVTESVALGSTRLPYAATAATLGTAAGGTFQSLFFV